MLGAVAWYQSRTVVASLVGVIFAALSLIGVLPEWLEQEKVIEIVLLLGSVFVAHGRVTATKEIVGSKAQAAIKNEAVRELDEVVTQLPSVPGNTIADAIKTIVIRKQF